MEKNNGRKWTITAFAFVCVAIAGLTVAFANLSERLNISPAATVKANEWKVEFANVVLTTEGDATATAPVVGENVLATAIQGIEVALKTPGDSATYTFDVVNKGGINAKIGTITIPTITSANCTGREGAATADEDAAIVCGNISYTLKYTADGSTPDADDALGNLDSGNNTRRMALTIKYEKEGITAVPTDDVKISGLDISINYVQD